MKEHVIKELRFFKNGCDINFLCGLQNYKCFRTNEDKLIAVILPSKDMELHNVTVICYNGDCLNLTLQEIKVEFDKRYKLYDLIK